MSIDRFDILADVLEDGSSPILLSELW